MRPKFFDRLTTSASFSLFSFRPHKRIFSCLRDKREFSFSSLYRVYRDVYVSSSGGGIGRGVKYAWAFMRPPTVAFRVRTAPAAGKVLITNHVLGSVADAGLLTFLETRVTASNATVLTSDGDRSPVTPGRTYPQWG